MNTELRTRNSAETDIWIRRDWIFTLAFIAAFVVPYLSYVLSRERSASDTNTTTIIVALILALHLITARWYVRQPAVDHSQMPALQYGMLLVSAIVKIALWFVLVSYSPIFMFGLSGLFPTINRWLPMHTSMPLNLLIAGLMASFYGGGAWNRLPTLTPALLLIFIAIAVPTLTLSGWIGSVINQSMERRNLIDQLTQVRRELLDAERRTGILEERQRLAREIHDTLAQGFTSIVMNLEAAEQASETLNSAASNHINRARETARSSLEQSRRVIADLRPEPLENDSFPNAIHRVVANWSAEGSVPAHSTVTGVPLPLTSEAQLALLRAVQESLNNVRKHAEASSVNVTLSFMDDVVMLDVQDDGKGIQSAKSPHSYGLVAMRERINALKGSLEIESEANQGTTVVVTVPV